MSSRSSRSSQLAARSPLALAALLCACNVTPASTTGGVDLPARGDCPRGLAVVSSDYQSSEIALLTPEGDVKSAAFMSSASTQATNLAAALSGDIGTATTRSRPGELVIVDRFGTNVLTFVDAKTVSVRAQLPVGTGFEANAQDYLELNEHLAFVPRLGENRAPGREPFDGGSDLLMIDPSVPSIVGSLPMPRKDGYFPNPVGVLQVGNDVLVTLVHARPNYSGMADSELCAFATADSSFHYSLPLTGLKNCGRAELSPSGKVLAVACSGYLDRKGAVLEPETAGLVLLDATRTPPQELRRFTASELLDSSVQGSVEFANDDVLLLKTQTALGADSDNRLFSLRLESGETTVLATAARGAGGLGYGIAFGGLSCQTTCGGSCFVADASRGKLLRFPVDADALGAQSEVAIGGAGLPPLGVTPFF